MVTTFGEDQTDSGRVDLKLIRMHEENWQGEFVLAQAAAYQPYAGFPRELRAQFSPENSPGRQ
jgi:hypothetical protein